ncbi:unnamed protein product, partial [Phaeothamnion confervicola]
YLDDLWALDVAGGHWLDEAAMGFPGPTPLEGRGDHSLSVCGDRLVLLGGFVGDGFDGRAYVAD